jgi:oligosaccharide repeat unit polymerase
MWTERDPLPGGVPGWAREAITMFIDHSESVRARKGHPMPPIHRTLAIGRLLRHPIMVIGGWWIAILVLANIMTYGVGIQPITNLVIICFIGSILTSGVWLDGVVQPHHFPVPRIILKWKKVWIGLALLVYLYTLALGVVGYKLQEIYGNEFRALVFGAGGYDSILYGSYYLQVMAGFVLAPLVLLGVIGFPVAGIYLGKFRYILIGIVFAAAADFQSAGRFNSYFFMLSVVLTVVFSIKLKPGMKKKILASAVVLITLMVVSTARRNLQYDMDKEGFVRSVEQAVDYHLYGVNLLNSELVDEKSVLRTQRSYGRLVFLSYPDKIACMALRRFGFSASPLIDEFAEHWQGQVVVGVDKDGTPHIANAFYTSIYAMYYDFGILGVILIPIGFLFVLTRHYKSYVSSPNLLSLFVVVFISVFFLTSIFNSKITSIDFVTIFLGILLISPSPGHARRAA